jgi:hypothetical protein
MIKIVFFGILNLKGELLGEFQLPRRIAFWKRLSAQWWLRGTNTLSTAAS